MLFHSRFGVPAQSAPRVLETPMNKKLFGRLLESMRQHSAIARGERAPSRVRQVGSSEIHAALFPECPPTPTPSLPPTRRKASHGTFAVGELLADR